jgi:hypothetical protein
MTATLTAGSTRRAADRIRTLTPPPWVTVAVSVLVGFQPLLYLPGAGLDSSWNFALSLAHHDGLAWGRDVAFTYGPLGFLSIVTPLSAGMTAVAVLAQLAVTALCATACVMLVGRERPWIALGVSILTTLVLTADGYPTALLLVVALLAVTWSMGRAPGRGWPFAIGLASGLALLVKFNLGVTTIAVAAVAAVLARPTVRLFEIAGGAVIGVVGGWLAAGQSLSDFVPWLRQSVELARGFSLAMGTAPSYFSMEWLAAAVAAGVILLLLALSGVLATSGLGWRARAAVLGILLIVGVSAWFAATVRFDRSHMAVLPLVVIVLGLPLSASILIRPPWAPVLLALATIGSGFAIGVALTGSAWLGSVVRPAATVEADVQAVRFVSSSAARTEALDSARREILESYPVPDWERTSPNPSVAELRPPAKEIFDALAGRSVHVEPWAVSLAWAAGLSWHPVPVFQSYTAYTADLDELNASALSNGPEAVLRQSAAIDKKNPLWESPRYQEALLCRFRQVAFDGTWQALVAGPDRCGAPQDLGSMDAAADQVVPVPMRANALVVANVEPVDVSGQVSATLTCGTTPYRVGQGLPSGPLVMDASPSGWSQASIPSPCTTLSSSIPAHISFSALPLAP